MQERNYHIIAFHSSSNVFKVTLKSWHLYQNMVGVFPHIKWTFIRQEPAVPILGKNGRGKNCTLVLNFSITKSPNPLSWSPNPQLKSSILILRMRHFYQIFYLCHYCLCSFYLCHFYWTPPVPDHFLKKILGIALNF